MILGYKIFFLKDHVRRFVFNSLMSNDDNVIYYYDLFIFCLFVCRDGRCSSKYTTIHSTVEKGNHDFKT